MAQEVLPDSTSILSDTIKATNTVIAPDEDSNDNQEENVIGSNRQAKVSKAEANVLGMPVYYDTLGNVINGSQPSVSGGIYHRPRHHYLNSLHDRYCAFFGEGEVLLGASDIAGGLHLAYIPRRWGCYTSLLYGIRQDYLSVGPALRLSNYDSSLDWQLYGGIVAGGRHIGAEAGIRVALPQRDSDFCWTSASMGMGVINGDTFFTIGLSVEIIAFNTLCFLIF